MSGSRTIAVIGSGAMADDVSSAIRHSPVYRFAGAVEPGQSIPDGTGMVINLASGSNQISTLQSATSSGLPVATLPLTSTGDDARAALGSGRVMQVSPLRGFEALEAFRADVRSGKPGRPYGIFAAHRVKQGTGDLFDSVGVPLLHFVFDLFDEPLARVQTTRASLFGSNDDAWFILARGKQDLLLTIEFAASIASSAPAPAQVLMEATGSEAVLRVEPSRQVIEITGKSGVTKDVAWWPDEAPGFVDAAVQVTDIHEPKRELAFLDFVAAVRQSAEKGEPVELS